MKNSALKRIIAVVLCLVVFAGSELTGLTNIVGDLFASENPEIEMEVADSAEPTEETEEIVLSAEESEPEEEPAADAPEPGEESAMVVSEAEEETPEDETQLTEPEEITAEETQDDVEEAPADTEGEDEAAPVADTEEESEKQEGEDSQDKVTDSQETETSAEIAEGKEGEAPNDGEIGAEKEALENTADGEETEVLDEVENADENEDDGEEEPEAFDEEYKDGQVVIRVEAEPGVVPNGTELSVKKIVQRDVEALDDEEEIKEAEELNAKYEDIQAELELSVADDDTKEIAAFVAYDVNFLLVDEDGETTEIEPDGEVSVSMEFEEAYLPEEIAEKAEQIDIESIDVIHMEEAGEDEESETGLKSEVVADADVSTTENAVEKAEFTTGGGKTFVITWTENDLGEREYVCETEDATIKVTAAKGVVPDGALLKVVPILADNEATRKQYQDVEKKLLEKAESEEYEIAGFLAYDISFTDEAGAKLEPNGEVKVAIDYKKAAIPEDLKDLNSTTYALDDTEDAEEDDAEQAETAPEKEAEESGKEEISESGNSQTTTEESTVNITVMHLEENDQGQVTKVVDMGAEGKVTALNSTLDQKITGTEFVTESFSAFTIVWMSGAQQKSITIKFYDVNNTVEELNLRPQKDAENWGAVELKPGESFKISDIQKGGEREEYYQLYNENGIPYTFVRAGAELNNMSFGNVQAFELTPAGLTITTEENAQFDESMSSVLTFSFYYRLGGDEELEEVETIDNQQYGITMRMIDYDETVQGELLGNSGAWKGGNLTQGVVKKRLENGYPVTQNGQSLERLFGETSDNKVTSKSANHLFRQDIYDETKYFSYSSFENYAYLDGEDFKVYTGIGTPGDYDNNVQPNQEVLFYKRGNFLPYNEIAAGRYSEKYYNLYDKNGNRLSAEDDRYMEPLYSPTQAINYSFGMYIEAVFLQPEGGQVEDAAGTKSNMRYEFNGDDDLWVFIDDTLVLDIGGSHDARSGYIDFATGTVHIEQDGIRDTTIKDMFYEAKVFPDGSIWNDEKEADFFKGNTFADFSTHRMKMFYMEHGGAASNLNVKMNLPTLTIPKGTVEVAKQLGNTDKEKYKDVEFAFQVLAQKIKTEGNEKQPETYYDDQYVILRPDELTDKDGEPITGKTGNDNTFYLKPGETARFKDLQDNRKYYVKEIGVNSGEYDKVTITGTSVEHFNNEGGSTVNNDVVSSVTTVGTRPRVVYTNECSAQNSRRLQITKQMASGQSPEGPTDTFTFKVSLGEKPYDGQYVLIKSDGTRSKNLQASSNGEISGVAVGDTVEINQIMSDTIFKVEEVNPETETYTLVGITGKSGTYAEVANTGSDSKALNGKILLGQDAEVTVTNALKNVQTSGLSITKKLKEGSPATDASFAFHVYQMVNGKFEPYEGDYSVGGGTKTAEGGKISIKADETAVIEMQAGTQFRVEETLSEGYGTPEITVTKSTVTVAEISENTVEGTVSEGQYAGITVTNVPAYSYDWQIVKKGTAESSKPLEGAEFTLTLKSSQGEKKAYYGKSQKDSGVILWFKDNSYKEGEVVNISDIVPGEYVLEETKAPAGYMLSNDKWDITLAYGSITVEDAAGEVKVEPTEDNGRQKYEYIFLNEAVYELPSTGGIGIHWYMISGTLLMMAGILILYKRKYAGEVLKG